MLSGSCGLVLEELDVPLFLQRAKNLTGADNVALVRWLEQEPAVELCDCFGNESLNLPADIKGALNDLIANEQDLPVDIRDLLEDSVSAGAASEAYFSNPRLMSVLLDTNPARVLFLFSRNANSAAWNDDERHSFMEVARVMRQSHRLHKLVDTMKGTIQTATGLFKSSPSGVMVMQPDGVINIANQVATRILNHGDGICISNNRLQIKDADLNREFYQVLAAVPDMTTEIAEQFQWHRAIHRREHRTPLQLSLQIVDLGEWHIESHSFDKSVIVYLSNPTGLAAPTIDQLKHYYGFTDAQAKLALALWGGTGIKEAAKKLPISINTARTHLRAIYEKVGVANHAELMAVLTTSLNHGGNRAVDEEFYTAPRDPRNDHYNPDS